MSADFERIERMSVAAKIAAQNQSQGNNANDNPDDVKVAGVSLNKQDDSGSGNDGEGSGDGNGDSGENQSQPAAPEQPVEKTFTQADVTRMMTREKRQGRNSVFNELGIDPSDAKSIAMVKALMESQRQSAQPAQPVSDSVNEQLAEAERRARMAEAKAEAMMLGVKPQFVEDVVTLATVRLAEQGENAEFKDVIGELKSRYPLWFGEDEDDKSATGKRGTGSSVNPDSGSKGSKENEGIGKRLAAQRKPHRKQGSYWGNSRA